MAPAAARTRPAWHAWTSVRASALRPDGRRHQRCLHHVRGYPRPDGCLVLPRRRLGRRRRLDGCLGLRLLRQRHLDAGRSRPDERHPVRAGLRRQDHRDACLERLDERQRRLPPRERLDVVHGAHQDVEPGRGCFRPVGGAVRPREAGTGCCRPDAGAAEACRKASRRKRHRRRCSAWQRRRRPGAPEARALRPTCSPGVRRRCVSRLRPAKTQRFPRRQVPMKRSPLVRVPLRRLLRRAWALRDAVRPAWVRSPPWGSRIPERVPWRRGRLHGPCERRGLPASRTVP